MGKKGKRSFGNIRRLPGKDGGRYQARYTGPDGGAYKAPHTFADRIDAEEWLAAQRRDIDWGRWRSPNLPVDPEEGPPPLPSFADYANTWLPARTVRGRPLKTTTRNHYRDLLDRFLIPEFGNQPLDTISRDQVRRWHAHLLLEKPTMRAHTYSLLRTILNSAIEDEYLDANPCKVRGAGKAPRESETRPATPAELAAIANGMPDELRTLVLLAGWCAMRFGELAELRRRDIADDGATVRITRAVIYDRAAKKYVATTPKSDAGRRDIAVPPHIVPDLRKHLERHTGPTKSALLFPGPDGYLTPARLYRWFFPARDAAGRPDLRLHDLRHSGATMAAQTGATLAELQTRLGHSTVEAAMRYQHAAQSRDKLIAAKLSRLAEGGDTPGATRSDEE